MDLRDTGLGGVDWIRLAQDRYRWTGDMKSWLGHSSTWWSLPSNVRP
jgi:hypothetical protein